MRTQEGRVTIEIPGTSEEEIEEDVFYNPNQVLNRDLTLAVLRAYRDRDADVSTYLDAMAASGIRGLRAAADGWQATMCDRNPKAVDLCRHNLDLNDLSGTVVHADANAHIHGHTYDVIDIDPFGSPMPFADSALSNARRLVCITATDTAPLCGAHFNAGVRRYDAVPRNTEYHPEMGLRILISAIARTAARYDRAITPLLSHATRHYVRGYFALETGAQVADTALDNLGYLHHCEDCLYRRHEHGRFASEQSHCPNCESNRIVTAGPIWLGPTNDSAFLSTVTSHVDETLEDPSAVVELIESLQQELDVPTHYDQHRLCKEWSRPASPMDEFLTALRDAGYRASRAHYSGTAFKTDATVEEIRTATAE